MTVRFISLGIILDDIVFPDGRTQMGVLGGGGAQTAWGMGLVAPDPREVGIIGGVGQDFHEDLLAPLLNMGIDVTGVHATDLPTPRAWQLLEEDGRRTHVWRVPQETSDRQTHPPASTILAIYPHVELVQWGIHPEAPYLAPCHTLHEAGVRISLEPFKGLEAPLSREALQHILTSCDIFSPNWGEAVSLFGTDDRATILELAREYGGHILALRMGRQGAEVWDLHTRCGVSVPPAPTAGIVDPVGAGDAFCGAFSVTWHITGDLMLAAADGAVAASFMLEQIGMPLQRPEMATIRQRQEIVLANARFLQWPE